MLKRLIGISFIVLANIILLAHSVIPHHHHDRVPLIYSYSQNDDHDHDSHHPLPNHSDQSDSHYCLLNQDFIIRSFLSNETSSHRFDAKNFSIPLDFQTAFINPVLKFLIRPAWRPGFHEGTQTPLNLILVIQINGLRAPPIA